MKVRTVAELMTPDPITVSPNDPVVQVRNEMELAVIRHLPVLDDGVLVGLVSQRDLLSVPDGDDVLVGDIMTTDVKTVGPETAAYEAAYLILSQVIGCLPVIDRNGALLGIITDSDFVRAAYTLLGGRVPIDELLAEEREEV